MFQEKSTVAKPKRILVALDGSSLSFKALDYALMLASLTDSEIIAINVIMIPSFVTSVEMIEDLRKQGSSSGGQLLDKAQKIANDAKATDFLTRLVETNSSVVKAIVDTARELNADLIVIGTKGTTEGIPRLMLGSVAAGVMSFAACPVLAVR